MRSLSSCSEILNTLLRRLPFRLMRLNWEGSGWVVQKDSMSCRSKASKGSRMRGGSSHFSRQPRQLSRIAAGLGRPGMSSWGKAIWWAM